MNVVVELFSAHIAALVSINDGGHILLVVTSLRLQYLDRGILVSRDKVCLHSCTS